MIIGGLTTVSRILNSITMCHTDIFLGEYATLTPKSKKIDESEK
jgi:hypothetical protein